MNAPQPDGHNPEELLAELHREHHSVLMAQAVRLTGGDRAWAEDVVQETFIRAWRRIERMTAEHGSVRAWLMRVAHNLVMDGHRARRARPVEVEEAEMHLEAVGDASDEVLSSMLVDDALATLGARHREVLEETYLRDRTMAEAAQALNLPVGTVKSRVFYALRQLREGMAESTRTTCPDERLIAPDRPWRRTRRRGPATPGCILGIASVQQATT